MGRFSVTCFISTHHIPILAVWPTALELSGGELISVKGVNFLERPRMAGCFFGTEISLSPLLFVDSKTVFWGSVELI